MSDQTEREAYYVSVAEKQLEAWDKYGAGGIYWNYRLGDGAQGEWNLAWDLCRCVENGWIDFSE